MLMDFVYLILRLFFISFCLIMNFYKPEMLVKSHLLQAIYFVKLVHINSLHICKATRTSFIFEFILIIILISIDTLLYLLHFLQ